MDAQTGYMHKSKIVPVTQFRIDGVAYPTDRTRLKSRVKTIGDTKVKLTQIANRSQQLCHGIVEISNGETFKYMAIEALGGYGGIAFLEDVVPFHLVIVKRGDYDGRTILISASGKVLDLDGGYVSKILNHRYLVSFAGCDIGFCGFSVYDTDTESVILDMPESDGFEYEVFSLNGQLVIRTKGQCHHLDLDKKQLVELEVQPSESRLKYFDDFIKIELGDQCFCH
jgi:hypothetical protein